MGYHIPTAEERNCILEGTSALPLLTLLDATSWEGLHISFNIDGLNKEEFFQHIRGYPTDIPRIEEASDFPAWWEWVGRVPPAGYPAWWRDPNPYVVSVLKIFDCKQPIKPLIRGDRFLCFSRTTKSFGRA